MTVPELIVAMGVGAIVLIALASVSLYSSRSLAGMYNYVSLDHANRLTVDRMTREMRQARSLRAYEPNRLTFVDFDGEDLVYEYSPATKSLIRLKNRTEQTLLSNCELFTFRMYKSNPVKGTFDQALTSNVAESKVIGLNWTCSRRVLGSIKSSESVHSAKIVIRKS